MANASASTGASKRKVSARILSSPGHEDSSSGTDTSLFEPETRKPKSGKLKKKRVKASHRTSTCDTRVESASENDSQSLNATVKKGKKSQRTGSISNPTSKKDGNKIVVIYNESWSHEDEQMLQTLYQTPKMQFCMNQIGQEEINLYRKADARFSKTPLELVPDDIDVHLPERSKLRFEGREFVNPNWPDTFCNEFARVVCLPAFENDPRFLSDVLRYALRKRLDKNVDIEELVKSRSELFIDEVQSILPEDQKLSDF